MRLSIDVRAMTSVFATGMGFAVSAVNIRLLAAVAHLCNLPSLLGVSSSQRLPLAAAASAL